MGLYIKGMKMPENCAKCMMRDGLFCMANDYKRISYEAMHRREEWCPLVELPEKHGRLIDADELKEEFPKDADWEYPVNTNQYVCEMIDDADVVIEAEDE